MTLSPTVTNIRWFRG